MIAIEQLRQNTAAVRTALEARGFDTTALDKILELDGLRRDVSGQIDALRMRRNAISEQIGKLRAKGESSDELAAEGTRLKTELPALEARHTEVQTTLQDVLAELPNLLDERVPAGGKESNQVVRTWGSKPELPPNAPDHVALCSALDLIDYQRGTKLSGSGFWIYKGQGAALEWSMLDFFCREHHKDGYTFMLPPHLLLEHAGYAAGQFPKFRDDVFHLRTNDDERPRFLLPTSETAILSAYGDEVLEPEALPIKAFAFTPCYRREAGAYRAEERGTIRGHQFNKVEMFQFVTPEDAEAALQELVRKAESLVEQLGLHYRTMLLAARDVSHSMRMTYDIEVWIPSLNAYKEVSSVSWAGDYQARRAGIRYKPPGQKKTAFVHTLNASGLATSRLLPALVEQHQQPDGSIAVPKPLHGWVGEKISARR
jgi:seryl-tRNA synthetase